MSDFEDDDFLMEDDDFEDSSESEINLKAENIYYEAKSINQKDPLKAVQLLTSNLKDEQLTEIKFKSYKQIIKIFNTFQEKEKLLQTTRDLVEELEKYNTISSDYVERSFNNLLNKVCEKNKEISEEFIEIITIKLGSTKSYSNVVYKYTQRQLSLLLETRDYTKIEKLIKYLNNSFSEELDQKSSNIFIEYIAFLTKYYGLIGNNKKLEESFERFKNIKKSIIGQQKTVAEINEYSACIYTKSKQWDKAYTMLFECFKAYEEIGSKDRLVVLKKLLVVMMLSNSNISIFNSQEIKPYEFHSDIIPLKKTHVAFLENDIKTFIRLAEIHLKDDSSIFTLDNLNDLTKTMKTNILTKMIKIFSIVTIEKLSQLIDSNNTEVVEIISMLISQKKISANIDLINNTIKPNLQENGFDLNTQCEFIENSILIIDQCTSMQL